MNSSEVIIKNMVCPRCIAAVETLCKDLNIAYQSVELEKLELKESLSNEILQELDEGLKKLGFERSSGGQHDLITHIKSLVIHQIHHNKEPLTINFSNFLSEQTHHEYTYLSRLFSSNEGETLEQFILKQKIEKVKELLSYDEMSLTEIAYQLNYSSAAYLSSQFKKITGQTPSAFKNSEGSKRLSLDKI